MNTDLMFCNYSDSISNNSILGGNEEMKILLLTLTLYCGDILYIGGNPQKIEVVSSVEEASIRLWEHNQNPGLNSEWDGKLYEVDLASNTVREITIPKITFKEDRQEDIKKRLDELKEGL